MHVQHLCWHYQLAPLLLACAAEAAFPRATSGELPTIHVPGGGTCALSALSKGAGRFVYMLGGAATYLQESQARVGDRLDICEAPGGRLELRMVPAGAAPACAAPSRAAAVQPDSAALLQRALPALPPRAPRVRPAAGLVQQTSVLPASAPAAQPSPPAAQPKQHVGAEQAEASSPVQGAGTDTPSAEAAPPLPEAGPVQPCAPPSNALATQPASPAAQPTPAGAPATQPDGGGQAVASASLQGRRVLVTKVLTATDVKRACETKLPLAEGEAA